MAVGFLTTVHTLLSLLIFDHLLWDLDDLVWDIVNLLEERTSPRQHLPETKDSLPGTITPLVLMLGSLPNLPGDSNGKNLSCCELPTFSCSA